MKNITNMQYLKAVIVEDEPASRNTLKGYLEKYCEGVEVVDMADSAKTGLASINKHKPDIVFLDVEMPYGNAFDLLESCETINFETVFVTAFDNYAMKALNMSAAYYILKPVDIDELVNAVEKIKLSKNNGKTNGFHTEILLENMQTASEQLQKVILPLIDGFEVVQVKEIIRCEANDNFTNFHLENGNKVMICRTLKHYETVLGDFGFIRIHKSHMINTAHVKKYKKGQGGKVIMSDGAEVDISSGKKKDFLAKFHS